MSSQEAIVVSDPESGETALATMDTAPAAVLAEAQKAARALQDVISRKPNPVLMNGQQYLEFEDWQTLGRFYGITAREDGDPELVSLGGVEGFKASAVAVDRNGRELSRATAYCLNDEEKWSTRTKYAWAYVKRSGGHSVEDPGPDELVWVPNPDKPGKNRPLKERVEVGEEKVPLFQLASMAQTRAAAKALRNVLSWVAVLAGYKPTPAEEIEELAARQATARQPERPADREPGADDGDEVMTTEGPVKVGAGQRAAAAGADPNPAHDPQARPEPRRAPAPAPAGGIPPCPQGHSGRAVMVSKVPRNGQFYCKACSAGYGPKGGSQ